MPNIEIKAKLNNFSIKSDIENKLENNIYVGVLDQTDIYYKVPNGRLKLRLSNDEAFLIPYVRSEDNGIKKSNYSLLKVDNKEECKEILSNMFETDVTVKKLRVVYLIDNIRIHIDNVDLLGHFIEFEAVYEDPNDEDINKEKIVNLMSILDIKEDSLIKESYKDLIQRII